MSGLAAIAAMECGWVVTEVGRQPWVVYGCMTTAQAATTNDVAASLSVIVVVYGVLGVATIAILLMLSRQWRREDYFDETPVPYGPPGVLAGPAPRVRRSHKWPMR